MAFFANRPQKLILPESLRFRLFPANNPGAFGQNLKFGDSARPGGLEPPTSGFGDLRSTN